MNHLGDTNKMVDTPRTDGLLTEILDAFGYVHQGNCPQRWVNHSRELERELNAANQRIKRLEEALDTLICVIGLTPIKSNREAFQEAFDIARTVLKAKEAKP